MENFPIDILVMMALDMDTVEAVKLCKTSTRLNRAICNNPNFWRSKIERDFGFNFQYNDVNLLREYYRLLHQAPDNWSDSYMTAYNNNYKDLLLILKSLPDIYGSINIGGRFRIFQEYKYKKLNDRRTSRGRQCNLFTKSELITIAKYLKIPIDISMARNDLCQAIQNKLKDLNLIIME